MAEQIVTVDLGNGLGKVRFEATSKSGYQDVATNKTFSFEEIAQSIEGITTALQSTLMKVKPHKATVEFGVVLTVETGSVTALIVKGNGSANLKVTLEWSK